MSSINQSRAFDCSRNRCHKVFYKKWLKITYTLIHRFLPYFLFTLFIFGTWSAVLSTTTNTLQNWAKGTRSHNEHRCSGTKSIEIFLSFRTPIGTVKIINSDCIRKPFENSSSYCLSPFHFILNFYLFKFFVSDSFFNDFIGFLVFLEQFMVDFSWFLGPKLRNLHQKYWT